MKRKVLVILGPTASGKSDLGVRLAKKFKGEIISADSRQVYRSLNIGSGKITQKEMQGVPHHLLDVADPKKQFSVSDFVVLTNQAIAEIVSRKKLPLLVGGTGFYIDAIAGTVAFPDVPPDKLLRRKLNKLSKERLFNILKQKDPLRAKTIDPNNKIRLIRALEIVQTLGKVPPVQHRVLHNFIYIGLLPQNLDERIRARMFRRLPGIIKEGHLLKKAGLSLKRMRELGLEYRYLADYLQSRVSKSELGEKIYLGNRQFAKRQMSWFKRNRKIKWFKPEEYKEIEKYLKEKL